MMTNRETMLMAQAYMAAKGLASGRMMAVAFNGARTEGVSCRHFDLHIDSDVDAIICMFPGDWFVLTEIEIAGWQDSVHLGQRCVRHHSGAQRIYDSWIRAGGRAMM